MGRYRYETNKKGEAIDLEEAMGLKTSRRSGPGKLTRKRAQMIRNLNLAGDVATLELGGLSTGKAVAQVAEEFNKTPGAIRKAIRPHIDEARMTIRDIVPKPDPGPD